MRNLARRRRLAWLAAAALALGGVTLPATAAQAAPACDVDYTTNDWNNGFTANVTIKNLGDPINGWTLRFAFPGNQRVTQGWSARWSQSGNQVTATNESYNGNLATGSSVNIGFNGSYTGSNPKPTSFSINGVTCGGVAQQPPTVSLSIPAGPFVAPASVPLTATASSPSGTISRVEFYRNGLLVNTDTTAPYAYTLENLPAGDYTVQARAYDNSGLSAIAERSFTVTAATSPALVVTPAALSVPEGGSSTFNVKLNRAPTGNVTVTLARTGDTDITVSPTSVTLTPSNWNTGVDVTVRAAEDADTVGGTATITASATGYTSATVTVTEIDNDVPGGDGEYVQRFLAQYGKIKNSGYFSPEGVPYHSIETLIVEAPDHGHETTSEAFSFWLWLEAYYGRVTQNWAPFNNAWTVMEKYIIPSAADQPTAGSAGDATYAAEHDLPSQYPSQLDSNVPVGKDPLRSELQQTYGTGSTSTACTGCWTWTTSTATAAAATAPPGRRTSTPSSGAPRSRCGRPCRSRPATRSRHGGQYGYLDLFIKESQAPAKQWKYTNAPDADARAVQAAYWALTWAKEQSKQADVAATVTKAAKMGDYLRYALFDKYFKRVGNCVGASACPAGNGRDSAHYLLSWYYAWGGAYETSQNWSWRIGSSHSHFGYQNPFAAWALTNVNELKPTLVLGGGGLDQQPQPAAGALHLAPVGRGRHRRWRDQQLGRPLRHPAGRHGHLLRHVLRRGPGLQRPAVEPVVRHAGLVDAAHRRAVPGHRQRQGQGAAGQVGAVGHRQHHDGHQLVHPVGHEVDRPAHQLEPDQPAAEHQPARRGDGQGPGRRRRRRLRPHAHRVRGEVG